MQLQFKSPLLAFQPMSTLAERVAEAIQDSGVDVAEIAKACKISVQSVYKWKNGLSKKISGPNLVELAWLTKYESRWIINGKGPKKIDPKITVVCRAMENMPEYKKDVLVQTSTALAEPEPKHNGAQ